MRVLTDDEIRDAYSEIAERRLRAGILDCSIDQAILNGKTVMEHLREVVEDDRGTVRSKQ